MDTPEVPDNEELKGFGELSNDPDLNAETLQKELAKYRKAYAEEYETAMEQTPENAPEYTQKFFRQNLPEAAAQIVWLAHNADSESVRLSALKLIVSQAILDATSEGDPVKDLLKQLSEKKKSPTPIPDPED